MATKIQIRRDTAANWASANPILMEGEMGIVTDDPNQYKIGDGVHSWNELPLRGYTGTIVQETGSNENVVMSQKATTEAIHGMLYDVSANNDGAVFESLSALLGDTNLSILIPDSVRRGGMTIRFIQGSVPNSDNKYVQYRLMANTFSTTVTDWQGMDDEPTAGSENLVKSGGVYARIKQLEKEPKMLSGTYEDALDLAADNQGFFPFMLNQQDIRKPIWHVGNQMFIDAAGAIVSFPIDHRFEFTVKLDKDNATVYVPVANGTLYTMSVDWGDGSTRSEYDNVLIGAKGCRHTYSGTTGDTFKITLRGTQIPKLYFDRPMAFTQAQLYSIDHNSLDATTQFGENSNNNNIISLKDCSNLLYVDKKAFSNCTTAVQIVLRYCSSLQSIPIEILNSCESITSCSEMFFGCSSLNLTDDFMDALSLKISQCTSFYGMFYGFRGNVRIPSTFFDNLSVVADVTAMTMYASGVTGDAKALYDVLSTKIVEGASTTSCFAGVNLSNREQVPTTWGGTMKV